MRQVDRPHPIVNFVMFQIGWFAAVLGAAYRQVGLGIALVAVILTIHIVLIRNRQKELTLILTAGIIGFTIESALILLQAYKPVQWILPPPMAPLWLVIMWMNIAITPNGCLRWLRPRPVLAALLGAIGGPVAYYTGERFGALSFVHSLPWSLGLIAIVWAVAMPGLFHLGGQQEEQIKP